MRKTGPRQSRRARIAAASGLLTTAEVARRCGTVKVGNRRIAVTAAAVDALGLETEWHHSGWAWKETNYYDPADLPVIRHYARWATIAMNIPNPYHTEPNLPPCPHPKAAHPRYGCFACKHRNTCPRYAAVNRAFQQQRKADAFEEKRKRVINRIAYRAIDKRSPSL